ncbi:hypothetical protein M9H77_00631 [Catharanthus roseus]|nr:hypothetical protein M9H77_00631 [Catharanthus roseus]
MAEPLKKRFAVGYALAPKKQASFIQVSLVNMARERGIDLIKIDAERRLIDQGPFDCVLHKMYGEDWKQQLRDYSIQNPSCFIIDSPEAIERLHNRITMLEVVTELNIVSNADSFGIPKQTVIYDAVSASEVNVESEGLKYPVIAKPLVADGSAKSHRMLLVFNNDGLNKLKPPIVLQEFVNHGGVIFKVYVVGAYVKCVKRKSLPDINEENLGSLEGSLSFSQVSNLNAVERNDDKYYKLMDLENADYPPMSLITEIAMGLRKMTRLHLFNFDVIRDTKVGNRYLVVDINYFPGYAKMPNYERVLTDFFWDLLSKKNKDFDTLKVLDCKNDVRLLVGNNGFEEDDGPLPVSPVDREGKENLQVLFKYSESFREVKVVLKDKCNFLTLGSWKYISCYLTMSLVRGGGNIWSCVAHCLAVFLVETGLEKEGVVVFIACRFSLLRLKLSTIWMPEADSPCVDVLLHLEKEAQHVLISSRARISIKPDFVSAKLMNRKSSVRGMTVMEVTTFCTEFICHVLLILTMKLSPCFNEQGLPLWKKFCLLGNAICANWFWGSSWWKGYEN